MFILILLLIVVISILCTNYFEYRCDKDLIIDAKLDHVRANINESFDILLNIENHKLLLLPFIKITINCPGNVGFIEDEVKGYISSRTYMTYLLSYQKSHRRISLHASTRGFYTINVSIEISDFLGFIHKNIECDALHIMIHPLIADHETLKKDSGIDGDILTERWLNPDPLFFTGVRPYTFNEPFKDIHWKSTAKTNEIQVKIHDTSSSFHVVLCLITENNSTLFSDDPNFFEKAIQYCAYYLNEAWEKQVPVGLITNAYSKIEFKSTFRADYALNHITRAFDVLSCVQPMQDKDSTTIYRNCVQFTESGNEIYFFVNKINDTLVNALYACLNRNIKPTVFVYDYETYNLPSSIRIISMKEGAL